MTTATSKADELVGLGQILAESGDKGLTIEEVMGLTAWDRSKTNTRLLDLGRQVEHEKVRDAKTRLNETRYKLKVR